MRGRRGANKVDRHIGLRLRSRRLALQMTQTDLADALGVTFQQVQKYEKGSNRISASTLKEMAETLKVPVAYFFEGLQPEGTRGEDAYEECAGWSCTLQSFPEPRKEGDASCVDRLGTVGVRFTVTLCVF